MESWLELYEQMGNYLAPSMAKDHPNLPVIKEEGCYYFGADGKTYLDFTAGIAVANTGHRHPKIVQSIKDAADQLVHGPSGVIMYESILKLSKNLAEITPGNLDCFFYGNSGTEAIEGAIKLAKFTTGRPYIISFTGCFHGRSLGALSVTTSKSKYRKFLNPSNVYSIPYANVNEAPTGFASVQYTVDLLEKNVKTLFKHQVTPEEVAAFIVEPVLGEGGYIIPPKEWLQKLRELCNEYGILLIFDEVQTGFGRTGEWFAAQTFGVTPDIMAIAKGIASGLPLSATVASRELMEKWPMGSHGTTFGGNPISCSVALTTLEVMKEENLLENTKQVGAYAVDFLKGIQEKYDVVGEVRAIGLMIGINIIDPKTGLGDGIALKEILDNALEEGVLFYLCGNDNDVIRMIPPLTVTKEQIDEGLTMLDHAIQKYMDKRSE